MITESSLREKLVAIWLRPSASTVLWSVFGIVLCLKLLRSAVTQTMFFDGLFYASLARNMAEGLGTVWRPYFTETTFFPVFAEHPPLMLWLEAVAYSVFGDSIWVAKGFALIAALFSGMIFLGIWRSLNRDDRAVRNAGMVPLALALIAARFAWSFANNMLENLIILFTSLAIYLIVRAYEGEQGEQGERLARRLLLMLAASVSITLAVLTKGPVGLFPLAGASIHAIIFRRPSMFIALRRAVFDTVLLLVPLICILALLWAFPEPRGYLERYLNGQLLASLSGGRGSSGGIGKGLWTLFRVNFWPIAVVLLIVLMGRFAKARNYEAETVESVEPSSRMRRSAFLFLVGLSASLPLLISPRINSFYFNPSTLYFAGALSVFSIPILMRVLTALDLRSLRALTLGSLVALGASIGIVVAVAGTEGEDGLIIGDARKIATAICGDGKTCARIIDVCPAISTDWQLYAYLGNNYHITLAAPGLSLSDTEYLIGDATCAPDPIIGYTEMNLGLSLYRMFRR